MTELRDKDQTIYKWTQHLFDQKKREAREMTVERLPAYIEDNMRRCEDGNQAVGAMVLAGIAACSASLKLVRKHPHSAQVAMAALLLYKEIMAIPGPIRVIVYDMMLHMGKAEHFATQVDWQAAQWLVQEAQGKLLNPSSLAPGQKEWLGRIALGEFPYGWTAEKPPAISPDGFDPIGRRRH